MQIIIQSYPALSAAFVGIITFYIHTFIGGKIVARPLLADNNLPKASKWLNYYCWHIATLTILFVSFRFFKLALFPISSELIELSIFALCLSVLSAIVALKGGINPLKFPSTTLFFLMGIIGLFAGFSI